MDIRLAPAEHYDAAMELLDSAQKLQSTDLVLVVIAHLLAGLLRIEMDRE